MSSQSLTKASAPTVLTNWTDEQLTLIKNTIAVGATDDELKLYLQTCLRTNLDPFMRQIYFVKRRTKMGDRGTIQVSIDGFRAIAARTGAYAGNNDPVFDNEQKPTKATVTVYRLVGGQRCPFTATSRWDQYYPGDGNAGFMWRKMPHLMLGKTAEALALRKAFPEALSGLYSEEEMQQADKPDRQAADIAPPTVIDAPAPAAAASKTAASPEVAKTQMTTKLANTDQIAQIAKLCNDLGWDLEKKIYAPLGLTLKDTPTEAQALEIIKRLNQRLDEALNKVASEESK